MKKQRTLWRRYLIIGIDLGIMLIAAWISLNSVLKLK